MRPRFFCILFSLFVGCVPPHTGEDLSRDSWFGSYMDGEKIGWMHDIVKTLENGHYQRKTTMHMKMRAGTVDIVTRYNATEEVDKTFRPVSFSVEMSDSHGVSQQFFGERGGEGDATTFTIQSNKRAVEPEILKIGSDVYSSLYADARIRDISQTGGGRDGERITFRALDLQSRTIVRSENWLGEQKSIYHNGITLTSQQWISRIYKDKSEDVIVPRLETVFDMSTGSVLTSTVGNLKVVAELPEQAQKSFPSPALLSMVRVPLKDSTGILQPGHTLVTRYQAQVEYIGDDDVLPTAGLSTDSQKRSGTLLTIDTRFLAKSGDNRNCGREIPPFTESRYIKPYDLAVIEQAKKLRQTQPWETVKAITNWVFQKTEKKYSGILLSGAELILKPQGDCKHHAILAASLFQAAGVPARITWGLLYLHEGGSWPPGYYYHAWNEVWVGCQWYQVDATHNQVPATAAHLVLGFGSLDSDIDIAPALLALLGKDGHFLYRGEG